MYIALTYSNFFMPFVKTENRQKHIKIKIKCMIFGFFKLQVADF